MCKYNIKKSAKFLLLQNFDWSDFKIKQDYENIG